MPFNLLKYGLSADYPVEVDLPPPTELKPSYDVVIIGGGGHGLAIAYYLPSTTASPTSRCWRSPTWAAATRRATPP